MTRSIGEVRRLRVAVAAFAATVLLVAGQLHASGESEAVLGVADADLRYRLSTADQGHVMLLETMGIANDSMWRDHFSGQVFGHGIRTEPRSLAAEDVALVTTLLLDASSWAPGGKRCEVHGDAAIVLTGPAGQVTIMLELWCARAWLRDDTNLFKCHPVDGDVDPVNGQLHALVGRYFPDDVYLQKLDLW